MGVDPLISSIVALRAAQTASSVQYAVAAKIMRTQRQNGEAVVKLIRAAGAQADAAAQAVSQSAAALLDLYA